jgi:dipeptidyl aminopeptidase/acylaminoacyl peptidase
MNRYQNKTSKPYGTWPSQISAELITKAAPGLSNLRNFDNTLFWVESRPWEGGRNVIMRQNEAGQICDVLPKPFSHQSKVHEYGGAAFTVVNETLYFVNASDQRIYISSLKSKATPKPLTPEGNWRFGDLLVDRKNQRLIAVCEEHTLDDDPQNYIASISLSSNAPEIERLESGADFYAYPQISPDGTKFCWIQWNHPYMPWDNTQLKEADIDSSGIYNKKTVAGENLDQSIFQPQWSPDNQLYFVSDATNWWNIWRIKDGQSEIVFDSKKEFGLPLWQLGMRTFCFLSKETIGCIWTQNGSWHAGKIDTETQTLDSFISNYTSMDSACVLEHSFCTIAGSPSASKEIVTFRDPYESQIVYSPSSLAFDSSDVSHPESIQYVSGGNERVHAFYYPPTNSRYVGDKGELPPAIAMCHGGPTSATDSGLNLKIQFWTSRGFAVVDINYRGSTGFGRKYRQLLNNNWGIADVEDTTHAMSHLASMGKIDPKRCIIRGGSAGGFTVLSALTFANTFRAGASLYGIGDLEILAKDTHKFESLYLESLIGPYPQRMDIYRDRSPIHHTDGLNCPVIFMQGLEDKVVPPNQAEMMVKILRDKGIYVSHVTFPDEGHGFRKAANIIKSFESELKFYQDVFHLRTDS